MRTPVISPRRLQVRMIRLSGIGNLRDRPAPACLDSNQGPRDYDEDCARRSFLGINDLQMSPSGVYENLYGTIGLLIVVFCIKTPSHAERSQGSTKAERV